MAANKKKRDINNISPYRMTEQDVRTADVVSKYNDDSDDTSNFLERTKMADFY